LQVLVLDGVLVVRLLFVGVVSIGHFSFAGALLSAEMAAADIQIVILIFFYLTNFIVVDVLTS